MLQKYWPKNRDVFKDASGGGGDLERKPSSSSLSLTVSRKCSNRSLKTPTEHINELETSRSNKDSIICECPPVDMTCPTDINEQCVYDGNDGVEDDGTVAAGI